MKTKQFLALLLAANFLLIMSCRKIDDAVNADPNAKQHNEDVSNTKSESDNTNTDVNNALTGITAFGKTDGVNAITICGATIDSSHQFDPVPYITITFDGVTVCPNPNRIRSGVIKVELIQGNAWTDAGAVVRITHTDYKVLFPDANNHFVTFNGTKYLTDVNGYDWWGIWLGTSTVTWRERSYDMTVTFENGQTSEWKTARLSTWGLENGTQVYAIVNGDTTINGKTIDSWGITRFGTAFQTEMIQPWKSGTTCGWWRPTQGKYTSTTDDFTITATFGVNSEGNQVSSGCAYGLKLDWALTNGNSSGDVVLAYW